MQTNSCSYCAGFLHEFSSHKDAYWNHRLFETENFVVVPTLGSIVEGWLLIITKKHLLSLGALDNRQRIELAGLQAKVSEVLGICYGRPTAFEHGPANSSTAIGCCVDHAHLHLVPLEFDLKEASERFSQHRIDWRETIDISIANQYYSAGKSYLYVEKPNGKAFISTPSQIPHQFFRQVIAQQVGEPEKYDWAIHNFDSNLVSTIVNLEQCKPRSVKTTATELAELEK